MINLFRIKVPLFSAADSSGASFCYLVTFLHVVLQVVTRKHMMQYIKFNSGN